MGWDYCEKWNTRAKAVDAALEGRKVLARKASRDGVTWAVVEYGGPPEIWAVLADKDGRRWGFKVVTESESPYYWSCPVEFFSLAPLAKDSGWRCAVAERRAA